METVQIFLEEVPLIVPVVRCAPLEIPYKTFNEFPTYCGAGGSGDKIVPDRILGLSVSAPCFIHDNCFELAEANWNDFRIANSVFITNLLSVIRWRSDSVALSHLRNHIAIDYYDMVDTVGAVCFWTLKQEQGLFTGSLTDILHEVRRLHYVSGAIQLFNKICFWK